MAAATPPTTTGVPAALADLFADEWQWRLADSPEFATWVGERGAAIDTQLDDRSLASFDRRLKHAEDTLAKLDAVVAECGGDAALSAPTQLHVRFLRDELETYRDGFKFRSFLMPLSSLEGPQIDFAQVVDWTKLEAKADYESLVARMKAFPAQVLQTTELLRTGVSEGRVPPAASIGGVEAQLRGHIDAAPRDTVFFQPFAALETGTGGGLDAAAVEALQGAAEAAVKDAIQPAFVAFLAFFKDEYEPACAARGERIGCRDLPDGLAHYAQCLRFHTSTTMTAEEIHERGLAEVTRIRAEMDAIAAEVGITGEGRGTALAERLRADASQVWGSEEELLEGYRALCKHIESKLPELFTTFPKTPYEVVKTPDHQAKNAPAAYYYAGTTDGSRPGRFYANTHDLAGRPKYEMHSLALHESIPGHHFQISLAQEAPGVPTFRRHMEDRRYFEAPCRFPLHTAFIEGWGLYSESLGYEIEGVYDTPETRFGALSFEIFRACRLVVDTGMHALGWSVERAQAFVRINTALSEVNIKAEIDRYLTWPGQACAYKVGQLRIRDLRTRAEKALGDAFDVRAFHDMVLALGNVPLIVLEEAVDAFIAGGGSIGVGAGGDGAGDGAGAGAGAAAVSS